MSRPGDVVWADGRSWTHLNVVAAKKHWWHGPSAPHSDRWTRLRHLKEFDDFRWMVRNGERVESPIRTAHVCCPHCAPTSHHPHSETAAEEWRRERDEWQVDARKLRDERDKVSADRNLVVNELADMTEARDAAAKGYLEKFSELEDIRAELSGWSIWKTDEPEPPLAEQVRTLRDAWRDVANERDNAKRILLDKTAFEEEVTKAANEERAAIVAWLRNCDGFTRFTVAGAEGSSIAMWDKNDYADAVEHGGHLRDDDE